MNINRFILIVLSGAIIAGISGLIIETGGNKSPWKIFSFLWAAPLLLFIPVYISYASNDHVATKSFLYHALIGSSFTTLIIIFTLFIMKVNVFLSLSLNLIASYLIIFVYFKYKIYEKI